MVELLGLKWAPIAGKFSITTEENGDSASTREVRVCDAFDVVRRENQVLKLCKENCVCPGGRHFLGLESLPLETVAGTLSRKGHKAYESMSTASALIRKQPQPVRRGEAFILGPLAKFESAPDVVFLFVNPAQADRVLGLVSFKGAEPFMYYPVSSICSTITNVLRKGKPEMNLISFFERQRGKWSPDELIIALLLKDFEAAVENIPHSGFGTAEAS
jgi:uncharacterized protein (DUF169 family)